MRVALAQLNTVVGDIDRNAELIRGALADAARAGADVTLVPELAITGYPPEDLLLRPSFAAPGPRPRSTRLAADVTHGVAVLGFPDWNADCYNAAAVVADGRVQAVYRKRFLPNYGVFDEARYFRAGDSPLVIEVAGSPGRHRRVRGHLVPDTGRLRSGRRPRRPDLLHLRRRPTTAARATAASRCWPPAPTTAPPRSRSATRWAARTSWCSTAARPCSTRPAASSPGRRSSRSTCSIADIDPVLSKRRRLREPLARRLPGAASEREVVVEAPRRPPRRRRARRPSRAELHGEAEVWAALRLGIRDYVGKNGFPGVLIGLSGGIDSALTAALAADALGPDRVIGVAMPSTHSAPESLGGAEALAESLGIRLIDAARSPSVVEALRGRPRGGLRRADPGHHRGEHPGPRRAARC